jgi:hypothetical protein
MAVPGPLTGNALAIPVCAFIFSSEAHMPNGPRFAVPVDMNILMSQVSVVHILDMEGSLVQSVSISNPAMRSNSSGVTPIASR